MTDQAMTEAQETLKLCAKLAEKIAAHGADPRAIALGFFGAAVSMIVEAVGPSAAADILRQEADNLEAERPQ